MKAIVLKVIDTDIARDCATKALVGFRTDDAAYHPDAHEPVPFSYRQNLREIIRQPINVERGADPEELDHALTIGRKLKKLGDGDTLRLDDDDYQHLRAKIEAVRWSGMDEWIGQFRDDLLHPTDISSEAIDAALESAGT